MGSILALVGWLALSYAASAMGVLFRPGEWYLSLDKPAWTPPAWIFGPVWTTLYALMGTAAWLVWRKEGWNGAALPLLLFLAQLAFNAAWTWIFFGLRRPGLALADIALLWVLILATLVAFWRVRPAAGGLLAPYLAWVGFAAALNAELWRRNPGPGRGER